MRYAASHEALIDLVRRAGELSARQGALPTDLGDGLFTSTPEAVGGTEVAAALEVLADRWQTQLRVLAEDARVMVDVLRTVDAGYVSTEMKNAARLREATR